jgi:hypothetical protein
MTGPYAATETTPAELWEPPRHLVQAELERLAMDEITRNDVRFQEWMSGANGDGNAGLAAAAFVSLSLNPVRAITEGRAVLARIVKDYLDYRTGAASYAEWEQACASIEEPEGM